MAPNVQDYADQLAKNGYTYVGIDKDGNEVVYQSGAYSAVHKADFVGRPPIILGGNPATGGEFCADPYQVFFSVVDSRGQCWQ